MDHPSDAAPASPPEHMQHPPAESFWLRQLAFARFEAIARWDPGQVEASFRKTFGAKKVLARLREITGEREPSDTTKLHLVLVAAAIERVKTAALADVARARLAATVREHWKAESGRWSRAPLALELYAHGVDTLLDVVVCDRWHAKRRCVMRVKGRAPTLKVALTTDLVETAATNGLHAWQAARSGREGMRLMRVFERKPGEVLVAFRRAFQRSSLRDEEDELVTGFTEESVILRLCNGAHRVDVTANRLDDAVMLANLIGGKILGASIAYVKRRDEVTETTLADLLERLRDPAADYLPLVEIKAEMPGEAHRPVKTLHGTGKNRIEETLQRESERTAFARDWKTVHHVKVLYEEYRFTVHFPAPGDPLALTYSDLDRDTDAAERFEQMLQDELGAEISITPRSKDPSGTPKRRSRRSTQPDRITAEHWRRLLGPVIDDPQPWENRRLADLIERGLVTRSDSWFFRCGDESIDRAHARVPEATIDCPGEIEWPAAHHSDDPYAALAESELSCPVCNATWRVPAYRPPLHARTRIELIHEGIMGKLIDWAEKHFDQLTTEQAGVASGMLRGHRTYLVHLDLAGYRAALDRVRDHRVIWARANRNDAVATDPVVAADFAELLASAAARKRLLKSATTSTSPAPVVTETSVHIPRRQEKPKGLSKLPEVGALALTDRKVLFHVYATEQDRDLGYPTQTVQVAQANAAATKVLLSVLQQAVLESRDHRTVEELTSVDEHLRTTVGPELFYQWVQRTRARLDKVAPGLGAAVIEGGDTAANGQRGYRLGDRYPLLGFQLSDEVQNWKSRSKNNGRS